MECLIALCLYFDVAAGQSQGTNEFAYYNNRRGSDNYNTGGENVGELSIGLTNKHGVYFEFQHQSALDNSSDTGINMLNIGFRHVIGFDQ